MKVKIRGLVFVGFAAAVFAQSAMANATTDAKTVTSKLYVDSKVVATDANNNNATTITQSSPDDKAPSALNVYKFVKGEVAGAAITIQGDNTYIQATEGSGDDAGKWTVSPKETVATTAAQLTGPIANGVAGAFTGTDGNKLVSATAVKALIDGESTNDTTTLGDGSTNATVPTSKNVVDYAEKKANKATAIVTDSTNANYNITSDTAYPTTKAVYDFVTTQGGNFQPKAPTTDGTSLYLGHNTVDGTTNTADWKKLEAAVTATATTNNHTSTNYVTIREKNGVYGIDIPQAQLVTAAAGLLNANSTTGVVTGLTSANKVKLVEAGAVEGLIAYEEDVGTTTITDAASGNGKVPTVKNVYDFVTTYAQDTYQPKVGGENSYDATGNVSKVMIGYTTRSGTAPDYTYSSEWKPLNGTPYVNVGVNVESNLPEVSLNPSMITSAGGSIAAATGGTGSSSYNDLLPTARGVNEYVTSLLNGNVLPAPGEDCQLGANGITDSNDKACALVLAYWTAADSPTGTAGVGLKWVPMAQTVSSGSSNP